MIGPWVIPRTATFAWSPDVNNSFIASGTKAGAVDEGFSNDTQLELWNLDLADASGSRELKPINKISTDSRFNDLAWTSSGGEKGIIAGALENGALDLWDAGKIIAQSSQAFLSRTSKHAGSIKALQFNTFRPELLATAGAKGELFISDINNVESPFRMGNAVARTDDFECLDWNKRTSHILVTGSNGGTMTVWDVKNRRESLTLNNMGRKPVSAVAWDPAKTTRLATAIPTDIEPLILVWDLRNAQAPERILQGHDGGILSLSWCQQDGDLLLSCGKDNRNICWNPQTGDTYGEFSIVTNWTFQTRWNPHNPGFIATSSFDGNILVHTVQNANMDDPAQSVGQNREADEEDFFNKAQTRPSGDVFDLKKSPKWLQRPSGVAFGFGGRVISFRLSAVEPRRKSTLRISSFALDKAIMKTSEDFEALLEGGDLETICNSKLASAKNESEKADWKIMITLISDDPRKGLVEYLGFTANQGVEKGPPKSIPEEASSAKGADAASVTAPHKNRLSAFFEADAEADNFTSGFASSREAKTNDPFHITSETESEPDKRITQALLVGNFDKALDICLQEDRLSDGFMIALCGGDTCLKKAQNAYLKRSGGKPSYIRLVASVLGNNLWDLVHNADVQDWKEVMTTLCTYANHDEFSELCEALGDRLVEHAQSSERFEKDFRQKAVFCYIAGSKLDRVTNIWLSELQEQEGKHLAQEGNDSGFSIHARYLQAFIEKVTVFREVTKYVDDHSQPQTNSNLSSLYERYIEYADIASSHGLLKVARRYLDLLPSHYAAADIARSRLLTATSNAGSSAEHKTLAQRAKPSNAVAGAAERPKDRLNRPYQSNTGALMPSAPLGVQNPYAPTNNFISSPGYGEPTYQPTGLYGQANPNVPNGGQMSSSSQVVPPPSKAANMANWNDMPESFFKPPNTSRRGTPSAGGNTSHTQNFQAIPNNPVMLPPKPATPVGPPPKAGSMQSKVSSPPGMPMISTQQPERPPSASNPYAPQQTSLPLQPSAAVPRGPSPYNSPPMAPPPVNRYTPSLQSPANLAQSAVPGGATLLQNPYAPHAAASSNTPQFQAPLQPPPPPPSMTSQRQAAASSNHGPPASEGIVQPPPSQSNISVSKKHAPGDRSHIPKSSLPIYELLDSAMQRIKSRAPPSFKPQVNDTEKRLNILFDHLNNEDQLSADTINMMSNLAQAIRERDYDRAQAIHIDIMTHKNDECGNWMVGVKRLIAMSKATPD